MNLIHFSYLLKNIWKKEIQMHPLQLTPDFFSAYNLGEMFEKKS